MALSFDALALAPAHAVFGEANQGFPVPLYTPQGGSAFTIDGIFTLPAIDVLAIGDAPGISTRKPVLEIRAALLPPGVVPAQGDQVSVRGVSYTVTDVQPDTVGLIVLVLNEA